MFTGLVTGLGTVVEREPHVLFIRHPYSSIVLGESVAVNGACLTVAALSADQTVARFDLLDETIKSTAFAELKKNDIVNLERALRVGDTLGGHWVTGHVDGVGTVLEVGPNVLQVSVPKALQRFLILKGSIALNGVSLTIQALEDREQESIIRIGLIPHTYEHTQLRTLKPQSPIHIEVDWMAKQLERFQCFSK